MTEQKPADGIRFSVNNVSYKANWSSGGWNGVDIPMWAPDHPLNRTAAFATSGILADRERIENDFQGYTLGAYKASGPVFTCITARQMVFSQAKFCWKSLTDDTLYGNTGLKLLETGFRGSAQRLLSRMEQDASLSGNSWWTTTNDQGQFGNAARNNGTGQRLAHMRPDWVTMVIGSKSGDPRALDAHVIGAIYQPFTTGASYGANPMPKVLLTYEEVAHYMPHPDPIARFRGMSWLTPVIRHIEAEKAATVMKGSFMENAAVPNMAIKFADETSLDDIEEFKQTFAGAHQGKWQAYKTLFLMGGADAVPLTHNFTDMDFAAVIGKDENMIANAAGVPASWVGFSEGMQGSALNGTNMAVSRRRFADGTVRPMWEEAVTALSNLVTVPGGAVLWWKEDGIAFLREDRTDLADIFAKQTAGIETSIRAGYEADASIDAAFNHDVRLLKGHHTGLVSVQMTPPVDAKKKLAESKGEAEIMQIMSVTIQNWVTAGYTHESAILAAVKNDPTLLVKDTAVEPWSPRGTALHEAGGGADNVTIPVADTGGGGGSGGAPQSSSEPGGGTDGP